MFATAQRGINAYASVGLETGVQAADPHKLVLMLYEGALVALADAKRHMALRETAAKGRSLSKAIMIIESGLRASLDVKAGGELGERLAALYDYMCDRLLRANLHNRPEIVDEVSRLLGELREAWEQIRPHAMTATAPGAAAR
jgi:flagellar secretion chaperone FliS